MPLLRTRHLSKTYLVSGKPFHAVHDVTLELWPGETLGLVGESGSGKSSLAKLLLGLSAPDEGSAIELAGDALPGRAEERTRGQLKALQIVFQNPGAALNRSQTVRRLIGRSLRLVGLSGAGAGSPSAGDRGVGAADATPSRREAAAAIGGAQATRGHCAGVCRRSEHRRVR